MAVGTRDVCLHSLPRSLVWHGEQEAQVCLNDQPISSRTLTSMQGWRKVPATACTESTAEMSRQRGHPQRLSRSLLLLYVAGEGEPRGNGQRF